MKRIVYVILVILITFSCNSKKRKKEVTAIDYHKAVEKLSDVMVHDIFSPPVASRVYVYPAIVAYEVMAHISNEYKSLSGQINDLAPPPPSQKEVNYKFAAIVAFLEVAQKLVFSEEKIEIYKNDFFTEMKNSLNRNVYKNSINYGKKMASHINMWMNKDNYHETRTYPKYTINTKDASRWQPTPPDYMDGIEPHWNKIRTFVLDSAAQFKPEPNPPFSMRESSKFYKELKEVYEVGKRLNKEQAEIASFWDCNPYVSVHKGHVMFALKKITPGGHWIGITGLACRKARFDFDKTVYAYAKTAIALADAFISCWDEKYRSNLIRPETLINNYIDEDWKPLLQTPPFPEYTSGHSVISAASAVALTNIFGENFAFADSVEVKYGLPVRNFTSFYDASDEAAISRLYGGIHYMAACENGITQGKKLGNYIMKKLNMVNKSQIAKAN